MKVRLAVGNPLGPNSVSVKFWTVPRKSDVYVAIREIGEAVKVSLHESGECHAGLTERMAAREPEVVERLGGSRHQHVWQRRTHLGSQECGALHVCFPASELRHWRTVPAPTSGIHWISAPPPDFSLIATCYFTGSLRDDSSWPRRHFGSQLLSSTVLPNGEKVWIVTEQRPTTAIELRALAEAATRKNEADIVPFRSDLRASQLGPRTTAFARNPDWEGYVIVDIADDDPRAAL